MAVGESQDCSWAARGWEKSLHFVFFSYASRAALKTDWKLEEEEEEEEAMGWTWDMIRIERKRTGYSSGWQRGAARLVFSDVSDMDDKRPLT
jgi:hypothetical protein